MTGAECGRVTVQPTSRAQPRIRRAPTPPMSFWSRRAGCCCGPMGTGAWYGPGALARQLSRADGG